VGINYDGSNQWHTKDKSLIFTRNVEDFGWTPLNSEQTLEFCYYLLDFVDGDEILRVDSNSTYTLSQTNSKLIFLPYVWIPGTTLQIKHGEAIKQWQCVTAATSFRNSHAYLVNFQGLEVSTTDYYADNPTTIVTSGSVSSNKNLRVGGFSGALKELKIWNDYLPIHRAKRQDRSVPLLFHHSNLSSYFKINEGWGTTLHNMVH